MYYYPKHIAKYSYDTWEGEWPLVQSRAGCLLMLNMLQLFYGKTLISEIYNQCKSALNRSLTQNYFAQ